MKIPLALGHTDVLCCPNPLHTFNYILIYPQDYDTLPLAHKINSRWFYEDRSSKRQPLTSTKWVIQCATCVEAILTMMYEIFTDQNLFYGTLRSLFTVPNDASCFHCLDILLATTCCWVMFQLININIISHCDCCICVVTVCYFVSADIVSNE